MSERDLRGRTQEVSYRARWREVAAKRTCLAGAVYKTFRLLDKSAKVPLLNVG